MNRYKLLMLMGVIFLLAACGKTGDSAADNRTNTNGYEQDLNEVNEDSVKAYRDALEALYNKNILPDGSDSGRDENMDITENRFAVADIDSDGLQELILTFVTAPTAGMRETIYRYDSSSGVIDEEFSAYPMLTYYDNGVIQAGWSHNQGRAGENFWPYSLYCYDAETDGYELLADVDAWDKAFEPDNFPGQADTDNAGIVFYVTPAQQNQEETEPVSRSQYDIWLESELGDEESVQVLYRALTWENIEALNAS